MPMTPRERVLTTLALKEPDRVPWVENFICNKVAEALLGRKDFTRSDYLPTRYIPRPVIIVPPELSEVLPLDSFHIRFSAPRFTVHQVADGNQERDIAVDGKIKTWKDIRLMSFPDPDDDSLYRELERQLERFGRDLARVLCLSPCTANTALSMGIPHFLVSLSEQTDLIQEILNRFADWSIRVIRNLQTLPIDLFWIGDDLAFNSGPFMSPKQFRRLILPVMKRVAAEIHRPWIFHSDGNLMPILDDLLSLEMNGLANIEPEAMDIEALKMNYGRRICLVGNIDLGHTLTIGSEEETIEEVRRRIESCGPGGGYILASSNSLPDYVKAENVRAMGQALLRFGQYPIRKKVSVQTIIKKPAPVPMQETPEESTTAYPGLFEAIVGGQSDRAGAEALKILSKNKGAATDVVDLCLTPTMEEVGRQFENQLIFLPEMMMAAKAAGSVLDVLRAYLDVNTDQNKISVVLGTVRGDVHDIGKNIVSMVLQASGYRVVDLGVDVPAEKFIQAVRDSEADTVGLSALLSCTLPQMGETVKRIKRAFPVDGPLILVGGAPVTDPFARSIGADFHGRNGPDAVGYLRKHVSHK